MDGRKTKQRFQWLKGNRDWIICNSVYCLLLMAGIAEVAFFCRMLSLPDLHGGWDIIRNCAMLAFGACAVIFLGIAVYGIGVLIVDWLKTAIGRKEKKGSDTE